MTLDESTLSELCNTAIDAARAAARYIQGVDRGQLERRYKAAGSSSASQVVTDVDIRSEAIIRELLLPASRSLDIAFVGEESVHEADLRHTRPYFWCVDPLDGTLPFVEGNDGYAVSIALVDRAGRPLIGVVCEPREGTVLHAIRGRGALRDGAAMRHAEQPGKQLQVFADRSFEAQRGRDALLASLEACAEQAGLDGIRLVTGAGAVMNAWQVIESTAACYLKLPRPDPGGGSLWDFAATACIAGEAKAWASNIHGDQLDLNRPDSTFMNHEGVLFASSEALARALIEHIAPMCAHS